MPYSKATAIAIVSYFSGVCDQNIFTGPFMFRNSGCNSSLYHRQYQVFPLHINFVLIRNDSYLTLADLYLPCWRPRSSH